MVNLFILYSYTTHTTWKWNPGPLSLDCSNACIPPQSCLFFISSRPALYLQLKTVRPPPSSHLFRCLARA